MTESRLWTIAAIGSGAFHVVLAIVLVYLPDDIGRRGGGPARDEMFVPGAVIPIETVVVSEAEPTPRPAPPELTGDEPIASAPFEQPSVDRPAPAGGSTPPDPSDAEQLDDEQRQGIALHGLRDRSTTLAEHGQGFSPAKIAGSRQLYEHSADNPGVGGGATQGPAPTTTRDRYEFKSEGDKRVYRDPGGRFVATLRADGRVDFKNKKGKLSWTDNALADPAAALARLSGEDPYATGKAKLLRATFDMRLKMAAKFQGKQIDRSLRRLDADLQKIWADGRRGLGQRKEQLFQRWDDCVEDEATATLPGFGEVENSELDDHRLEAGTKARRKIERFIRDNAPKDGAEAFSPAELTDMNRRRISEQKFVPYK